MKYKKIITSIIVFIIIITLVFLLFFYKNVAKKIKIGNNITSQEIVNSILAINKYEATIKVEVKSNKNNNKYLIYQKYDGKESEKQKVLEPSNISGVEIIKDNNKLTLKNSKFNLASVYENYNYLTDNYLDLNSFISNYKQDKKAQWDETDEEIIMKTVNNEIKRRLYINKRTVKPTKMEIEDTNKRNIIYILYNEVIINGK